MSFCIPPRVFRSDRVIQHRPQARKAHTTVLDLVHRFLSPTPAVKLNVRQQTGGSPTNRRRANTTGHASKPPLPSLSVTSPSSNSLPIATPEDMISELNLGSPTQPCIPNEEELLSFLRSKSGDAILERIGFDLVEEKLRSKEALGLDYPPEVSCASSSPILIPRGKEAFEFASQMARGRPIDRIAFHQRSRSGVWHD